MYRHSSGLSRSVMPTRVMPARVQATSTSMKTPLFGSSVAAGR